MVTQLAAGTVLGAIGKEVSKAITSFAMGGSFSLEVSVQNAFGTLTGNSNIGALEGGGIAAISSLLMSELADTLNLHGFEGGLFQTVGTTITSQLMTNALGMMTSATVNGLPGGPAYTMLTNFDFGAIVLQLESAVAGLFRQPARRARRDPAVCPRRGRPADRLRGRRHDRYRLSAGASAPSSARSSARSPARSSATSSGNDPEANGRAGVRPDGRFYPDPTSFTSANGASGELFMNIATYTGNAINALADYAGVTMSGFPVGANPINNTYGLQLLYKQDGNYFTINEPFQNAFRPSPTRKARDEFSPLINTGIMTLVHRVTIAGGDPLVRLAWTNSTPTTRPPSRSTCRWRRITASISTTRT